MRQSRQLPILVLFGVWAARSEGPSWRGRCKNTGSPGPRSAEWSISSHAACSHCGACSGLKSSKQSRGNCFIVQFRNMSCRKVGMKPPTFHRCCRKRKVQQRFKVVKEHSFIPNFGQERCQCARSYQVSI